MKTDTEGNMDVSLDSLEEIYVGKLKQSCTPACESDYFIYPDEMTSVGVWRSKGRKKKYEQIICLMGHAKQINIITFSHDKTLLCSCSEESIILWNFERPEEECLGIHVEDNLGFVHYCSFSRNKNRIVFCIKNEAWVYSIKYTKEAGTKAFLDHVSQEIVLEEPTSSIKIALFGPEKDDILLSINNINQLKLWNITTRSLLYQVLDVGSHSITYCSFTDDLDRVCLGTNRGSVLAYKMTSNYKLRSVFSTNVSKSFEVERMKNAEESGQDFLNRCDLANEIENVGEAGCIIFSVSLHNRDASGFAEDESSHQFWPMQNVSKCILTPGPVLIICSNLGVNVMDYRTQEQLTCLSFKDITPQLGWKGLIFPLIDFLTVNCESKEKIRFVLRKPQIHNVFYIVTFALKEKSTHFKDLKQDKLVNDINHQSEESSEDSYVTVMSRTPLALKSPLTLQLTKMESSLVPKYDGRKPFVKCLKKIKSSGYGKSSHSRLFKPLINSPSDAKPRKPKKKTSLNDWSDSDVLLQCGPPTIPHRKLQVWDTSGNASHLAATGNGKYLACSSSKSGICIMPFTSLREDKFYSVKGHNGVINSLHFSLDLQWLVSASDDCTVRVWDWKNQSQVLQIDDKTKYTRQKGVIVVDEKPHRPVTGARFFYMDQFILLTVEDALELYCHVLDECRSDVQLQSRKYCKRVRKIQIPAQKITCFSAANEFHSYLVLCGCSNKKLLVYDMNAEKFLLEIRDLHTRMPHTIRQMEGSRCVSHAPVMYDLFLTAAVCDGVKLWDLRTAKCVQKFMRHPNRVYSSGIDWSPCGRYVAASSDDKCVYIYDARNSEDYLQKLGGFSDVVIDVCFNPCVPSMAAASLNGYVANFRPGSV